MEFQDVGISYGGQGLADFSWGRIEVLASHIHQVDAAISKIAFLLFGIGSVRTLLVGVSRCMRQT